MTRFDPSTPLILLGGRENAVAVARNLGRLGVHITACGLDGARSMNSKYCNEAIRIPNGEDAATYWENLLLKDKLDELKGRMVLPFCDESLAFIENNHAALAEHYILEEFDPEQRRIMLDKQATLTAARAVNVPTPSFWTIEKDGDVEKIRDEVSFPVMVKPLDSYAFVHEFGAKLFIINDSFDEVVEKVTLARSKGHDVMVVEMIPGPDDLLSSYYTYRTKKGVRLFDYTKSIIRRWPMNRGGATFHQSEWLPETAEMGQRLFDGIDWQGIANVEFKRDTRDGQLKIIEVNARFTGGHPLVTAAGAPIDEIIYCHLTGQPEPTFSSYSDKLRLWIPTRDFFAFLELRDLKQLSTFGWIKGLFEQKIVLPYFSWTDPGPAMAETGSNIARGVAKIRDALTGAKKDEN